MLWQNIISIISSIGMFVLTLFYVIYTKRILKANQGMFEEAIKTRKQDLMPNVIAYFDQSKINLVNFIVENIGKTAAINTKIVLEPIIPFPTKTFLDDSNLINEVLPTIAPQQKLVCFVNTTFEIKDKAKYLAHVTFEDTEGTKYEMKYVLDLSMWKGTARAADKDINDLVKEVEKLRQHIEKLTK